MRATDLGHGRGWADAGAAASIRRVDQALGHPAQITEAGRDWERQNDHWQAYLRYLAGGPWAPIALSPDAPSIHQLGNAVDSDEWQKHVALLARHGWRRTVYRKINGVWTLVEPWHFEYFADRDQHRNDPAPAGEITNPPDAEEDEDDMFKPTVHVRTEGAAEWTLAHPDIGKDLPRFTGSGTRANSRKDGKTVIYRGFMVTADTTTGVAWARMYARGAGNETSSTNRAGYIDIQVEASRIAVELTDEA